MRRFQGNSIFGNVLWMIASVFLATGVWYIAVISADPITSEKFEDVPIQIIPNDSTVVINNSSRTADVTIQAAQTLVSSQHKDDVIVRADLSNLPPGTHTVFLEVNIASSQVGEAQRIVAHTQPAQITVELEQKESFQKPLEIVVAEAPPIGYTNDEPVPEVFQVLVSGASSVVSEVVAVRGVLNLGNDRNPIESDVRLTPVDGDGNRVDNVTIEPQTTNVSVNITRRDDVKQVSVRPNILVDTREEGYTLSTFSYKPQTIFIGGATEQLEGVVDTFFTMPISLQGHTSDFETIVPVELPDEDIFVIGGENNITVKISIVPQIAVREFDNILIERIGLTDDYSVTIAPQTISAIINGPIVLVEGLQPTDLQVVVDLNGLAPGQYDLEPSIIIKQGDLGVDNASLLPAVVNVEIKAIEPETEVTEEPIPVTTPTG